MAFRVLVFGSQSGCNYGHLRDTLDRVLANRLPDVEIVTAGGPGVPALAASYAQSRGLPLLPVPLDYVKYRGDAEERRAGRLVELADAAFVVWEDVESVRVMLTRLRAKGVRVVMIGSARRVPNPAETTVQLTRRGMLPD